MHGKKVFQHSLTPLSEKQINPKSKIPQKFGLKIFTQYFE
jgi:hypothetical protein